MPGKLKESRKAFFPFRLFPFSPFRPLLFTLLAMALGAGAVIAQNLPVGEKIPVVASIVPLGDFCRNLGGERVEVTVLIPPGASPHVFEPTPQAVARVWGAKVFAYVGAGLDPWAERLAGSREAVDLIMVKAVAGMPLMREEPAAHEHEHRTPRPHSHGDAHPAGESVSDQGNPHIWLDPVLARDICRRLAGALIQADPAHRQVYEGNLNRYLKELEELHQEAGRRTRAWRLKEYVAFHPSFSYFARRYGLKEVGVIEVAPGREPTPGHIQDIVKAVQKFRVRVVFTEPQLNPRMAEVIAREAGVKVLMLDPLGGRPPYGDDYLRMMRYNLDIMEQAMQ